MNDSDCIFASIFRDDISIGDSEWSDVILSMDFLEPMPDRKGINPFTSEEEVFSGAGKAFLICDGTRDGSAALVDGIIMTTGIPENICRQVATCLNARYVIEDRS